MTCVEMGALVEHDRLVIILALTRRLDELRRQHQAATSLTTQRHVADAWRGVCSTLAKISQPQAASWCSQNGTPDKWRTRRT